MSFSSGFSAAFLLPLGASGFVGPISAQRMLLRGFPVEVGGAPGIHWVRVGSRKLIGPAGKVFAFRSLDSASVWLSINGQLAAREKSIWDAMQEPARVLWLAKKRAQLERIAGAVIDAAARQKVPGVVPAMVAESDFCLSKWG